MNMKECKDRGFLKETNWRKCPECKDSTHSIKFRDEESIDGMKCQTCDTIWNVDWDTMTPLYFSSHNLSMDYHLTTIKDTLDYINNDRKIRNRSGEGTEKLDSMIHDLTKVVRLIKGLKKEES
tara:strand:+ start:169 stop:537 length:369 start_codon:yes stop_codon:yes gene_type:complete